MKKECAIWLFANRKEGTLAGHEADVPCAAVEANKSTTKKPLRVFRNTREEKLSEFNGSFFPTSHTSIFCVRSYCGFFFVQEQRQTKKKPLGFLANWAFRERPDLARQQRVSVARAHSAGTSMEVGWSPSFALFDLAHNLERLHTFLFDVFAWGCEQMKRPKTSNDSFRLFPYLIAYIVQTLETWLKNFSRFDCVDYV